MTAWGSGQAYADYNQTELAMIPLPWPRDKVSLGKLLRLFGP